MALALNVFKTVTSICPTSPVGIFTASTGYTGVVLLAQAANVGSQTRTISLSHERTVSGIAVTTEVVKNLPIPASDTANLLAGKLVLETDDILEWVQHYHNVHNPDSPYPQMFPNSHTIGRYFAACYKPFQYLLEVATNDDEYAQKWIDNISHIINQEYTPHNADDILESMYNYYRNQNNCV